MKGFFKFLLLTIYIIFSLILIDKLKEILEFKELIIVAIVMFIFLFLFILLLRRNFLIIPSYFLLILLVLVIHNIAKTSDNFFSFVNGIVSNENILDNYKLIVLKNKYENLNDLEYKRIGYTKDTIGIDSLKINITSVCYEKIDLLIKALNEGEVDGALVLDEQYTDIDSKKYSIIDGLVVKEEVKPVVNDVLNNTTIIYVSGMDNYESLEKAGRSDVNIIIGINTKTNQLLLISIPRDYYVLIPSKNAKDKLTHAGIYGINTSIETVENLLNTKINYYIKINFNSLEKLIDEIGGIEVESAYDFISSNVEFKKGINKLNGKEALIFSRERKGFALGDRTRGENQQRIIEGIVKKLSEKKSIDDYLKVLNIKDLFQTNIPEKEILKLAKNQIINNPQWKVTKYSLKGSDSFDYTYSYKCCKLYVMEPYPDTVTEASTLLEFLKNDWHFE